MKNGNSQATLVALAVAAMLPLTASAAWIPYDGHEYEVTSTHQSWVDAEAEAVSAGGHLVTINNAAENAWLAETFKFNYVVGWEGNPNGAAFNIGYYEDIDGSWKWISGETSTFMNLYSVWDGYTGPHAYMHTNLHWAPATWNHAYWHTEPPGELGYMVGVIERPGSPVPEPSTLALIAAGALLLPAWLRRRERHAH